MNITVQLYTVRNEMAADSAGTLKAIGAMGIRFVEGGGLSLDEAKSWQVMLGDAGLKLSGAHYMPDVLENQLDDSLAAMNLLGCKTVIVPWIQREHFATDEAATAFAHRLNTIGKEVRAAGFDFLYHNHDFEFTPSPSGVTYHAFLSALDKELCGLEVDVAWVGVAGHDPVAFLNEHQDRVRVLHLKDFNPVNTPQWTVAGQGTVPMEAILEFAKQKGIDFGAIELDESPIAPLDAVQQSFEYFKSKGFH